MSEMMAGVAATTARSRTKLNRHQIVGFWAAWSGWVLDGMDSVIYALVLAPALTELLPRSGFDATPGTIGFCGSVLFALFLTGWGFSFIWGPIADRFGRTKSLAATILVYSVFTAAAALSTNVYELAFFRFVAGIGIGGEWAMAGTYVSEAWPEDRRRMGAGYLQTGYYAGFFIAAILNYTVGAEFGWRAMFLCGLAPIVVSLFTLFNVKEPDRWERTAKRAAQKRSTLALLFTERYRSRTLVMSGLVAVAIIGLWAGTVYEPSAIIQLATKQGLSKIEAVHLASWGTALLSTGTIIGCLLLPPLAERLGRRLTLAIYFAGMMLSIAVSFGWAFYLPVGTALPIFIGSLFVLGMAGGNFAMFSLWLPELFATEVRATAFAFCTSIGRFIGAGINFALGAAVLQMGTIGIPVALTALAFGLGICLIPFAVETRGETLPS